MIAPAADAVAPGAAVAPALVEVRDLRIAFPIRKTWVPVVEGVDLDVQGPETVALVGESGCGKSVTALALARMIPPPGCCTGGSIRVAGRDVLAMSDRALRALRGRTVAYVFQDPLGALNPVMTVGDQVGEALRHERRRGRNRDAAVDLLRRVGLAEPERRSRMYPHELSGGMQQRAMMAMALACRPQLLVADEPTTALDATTQVQILDLLRRLQDECHMAVLLITHNFGVVSAVARRIYVMYAGRIVESGPAEAVLGSPAHPYTRCLIAAVPRLAGALQRLAAIGGPVPSPGQRPAGCRFHPRCRWAQSDCRDQEPELTEARTGHWVRCHYWKSIA